jgi:16S rRNA (adenine1518-N6/adenine1519-N6)-dimethyltransferase
MLQKEMVQRIMGAVGTKQYNGFTVFVQHHANISKLIDVSKNNFFPKPEIDSVVIEIIKNGNPYNAEFEHFLKIGFASRRKTILNNLNKIYSTSNILQALKHTSLPITVRADAVNVSLLFNLFEILSNKYR